MDLQPSERKAAILGAAFGVWLMGLIFLVSSADWRATAVAVVIGAGIVLYTWSASKTAREIR